MGLDSGDASPEVSSDTALHVSGTDHLQHFAVQNRSPCLLTACTWSTPNENPLCTDFHVWSVLRLCRRMCMFLLTLMETLGFYF